MRMIDGTLRPIHMDQRFSTKDHETLDEWSHSLEIIKR
jgi:hypothetical protein